MSPVSKIATRLHAVDPHYRHLVHLLADLLRSGRYNRALLLEAVLIADEVVAEEVAMKFLRDAPPDFERQMPVPTALEGLRP